MKQTTVEELARMVKSSLDNISYQMAEGFKETNKRLISIEGRLDRIEIELSDIKNKLDNVIYRHEFELLRDRITELENRVSNLKKK